MDLEKLQNDLEADILKKKRPKVKGPGFSKQKQILEESGYFIRKPKNKRKIVIKKKDGRKK